MSNYSLIILSVKASPLIDSSVFWFTEHFFTFLSLSMISHPQSPWVHVLLLSSHNFQHAVNFTIYYSLLFGYSNDAAHLLMYTKLIWYHSQHFSIFNYKNNLTINTFCGRFRRTDIQANRQTEGKSDILTDFWNY